MTEFATGARLRRALPEDRDALYRVCLLTGASGQDATGRYRFPDLLGDVFAGPYLALEPGFAFVLDGERGVEGYVLGALDSVQFAARAEREWWPGRRAHYAAALGGDGVDPESSDAWLLRWIESPPPVSPFAAQFPSHLHIDTLPAWHGGGWGRRLLDLLCDSLATAGSRGVHLGVDVANEHAIGFYRHYGFVDLAADGGAITMGLAFA